MSPTILVTGASGFVGSQLIPMLLQEGHAVRCLTRGAKSLAFKASQACQIAIADALDPDSLTKALEGIDTAYYLIHSLAAGNACFPEKDRKAAENFAAAAKQAGLKHIIYLGALGSHQKLSPHLQSRQEVGDLLRASGIPVTEFRAGIIIGSGSLSFEMIRYLTERLPIMICPRWVKSRIQPIALRDVLSYLVAALAPNQAQGKIVEIGGQDVLTYKSMMLEYARARGLKRWIIDIPFLTPRLSSYWVNLVTPIPAAISRALIEGLRNDVVCESHAALEWFSVRPMSYRAAIQLALNGAIRT